MLIFRLTYLRIFELNHSNLISVCLSTNFYPNDYISLLPSFSVCVYFLYLLYLFPVEFLCDNHWLITVNNLFLIISNILYVITLGPHDMTENPFNHHRLFSYISIFIFTNSYSYSDPTLPLKTHNRLCRWNKKKFHKRPVKFSFLLKLRLRLNC